MRAAWDGEATGDLPTLEARDWEWLRVPGRNLMGVSGRPRVWTGMSERGREIERATDAERGRDMDRGRPGVSGQS